MTEAEQITDLRRQLLQMELRALDAEGRLTFLQNQQCQSRAQQVQAELAELPSTSSE